jgi:hypothetical protein
VPPCGIRTRKQTKLFPGHVCILKRIRLRWDWILEESCSNFVRDRLSQCDERDLYPRDNTISSSGYGYQGAWRISSMVSYDCLPGSRRTYDSQRDMVCQFEVKVQLLIDHTRSRTGAGGALFAVGNS